MPSSKTAHSCTHCQRRFLIRDSDEPRPLLSINSPRSDRDWRLWPPDKAPITLSELKKMAQDRCAFAKYLCEKLTAGTVEYSDDVIVSRIPPDMEDTEPNSVVVSLATDNDFNSHAFFTYMAEADSTVAHEVPQRPPNLYPASGEAFSLARNWVQECLQHHSSCANPLDEFMPTRILQISSSGSSIHIRKDASLAPYAVLSYCWGGLQEITLTKSQVRLSQLSFSTAALPQTFQDAVLVCRELGLKYLWVDALCIVQDDPEDKAVEIGKMASIYQNSYVAILASRGKGVKDGFLQTRAPFGAENSPGFRLPYKCKDGKTGSVVLIEQSASQTYVDPLSTRAWAFQEFILSPRILDFGELRTTWICRAEDKPTDGFLSSPISCWSRQRFHELISPPPEANLESTHQIWSALVQCYMASSLTIPSDRLPALAGIAQRFNVITKDAYVAGCWKSHIWLDLMWWQENGDSRRRPPGYFAPSWSWASIPFCKFHYISTRSCRVDGGFQLLDYEVRPVYETLQYGTVASGFLQIRGRILPEQCLPSIPGPESQDSPSGNPTTHSFDVTGHYPLSVSCSIIPDPEFEGFGGMRCPALALCVCWDQKRSQIWGILLREVRPSYFVRAGLFTLHGMADQPPTHSAVKIETDDHFGFAKGRDESFRAWRESLPTKTMKIF
ncbi:heterokaryon incompatibility protein-domain-containing protein [Ilyonectria sp. MPI-CAGE-AT-0026]|nr:heterokaryon incompatibility protein-domain-containing protein [Ilyonectria sp. MPI-CAGE-AT-0026]